MRKYVVAALLLLALAFVPNVAAQLEQNQQHGTLLNSNTTGAANTAVTATLTGADFEQVHIYGVDAWCSAGTATLDVDNTTDTTQEWTSITDEVTTTAFRVTWDPPLTLPVNKTATVTLSTCGVSNTGTVIVQADRY